jgi:hypothetical protein
MTNHKSLFAQISNLSKIPGNKAPIVRLCLVAATLVIGLVLTVLALPHVTGGLGQILITILTGIVASIVAAARIWGFAKWAVFIFPKSFALANRFWNSIRVFGIILLVIKAMTWLYLLFLPITIYGLMLSPLYLLVGALSMIPFEFLSTLILVILCVGSLAFVILLDICHLTGQSWKETLRNTFRKIADGTRKVSPSGKR